MAFVFKNNQFFKVRKKIERHWMFKPFEIDSLLKDMTYALNEWD